MSTARTPLTIGITPGDPDGIGPEVAAKALRHPKVRRLRARFIVFGSESAYAKWGKCFPCALEELDLFLGSSRSKKTGSPSLVPAPLFSLAGASLHSGGFQSGWSVETAARLALKGRLSALVTGPISKENLQKGGYPFQGHTDFLMSICGARSVTMMLANSKARVSLVTAHCPLSAVPSLITSDRIEKTIEHTFDWLALVKGVVKPKIAVTGLNPHSGENGLLGNEERLVIGPTLDRLRSKYLNRAKLIGPVPADTAFLQPARYDAVVAMYHDQGLGPVKALDFANTVNITLGLPIVRTSVDHGTAFDIAGKGVADASSMVAAIVQAYEHAAKKLKGKMRA